MLSTFGSFQRMLFTAAALEGENQENPGKEPDGQKGEGQRDGPSVDPFGLFEARQSQAEPGGAFVLQSIGLADKVQSRHERRRGCRGSGRQEQAVD